LTAPVNMKGPLRLEWAGTIWGFSIQSLRMVLHSVWHRCTKLEQTAELVANPKGGRYMTEHQTEATETPKPRNRMGRVIAGSAIALILGVGVATTTVWAGGADVGH